MKKQTGQSLVEVLIALTVTVIMIVALISFILSGLKNAQFAQNQSKATKLAQETMDLVKTIRDRDNDGGINFTVAGGQTLAKFSQLFGERISLSNFKIEFNSLNEQPSPVPIDLGDGFTREIKLEDDIATYQTQKKITVIIRWNDSTGEHESNIQTILSPGI